MFDYDVIVVGLGGHGSAAVAHLGRRSARVLGLEKFPRISHSHGSSHGRSRIIRLAYFEDPRYVPLLRRSFELWRELNSERQKRVGTGEEPLLTMTGGLMIGLPDSIVIKGTLRSVKEHSLPHEVLTGAEIRSRFPAFQPSDEEIGVLEEDAGYLVPELCVETHFEVAEECGAVLKFEEPMQSWQLLPSGNGVSVTTANGTYTARRLVLSVGAWAPEIYGESVAERGLPLHASRRPLFWVEPRIPTPIFDKIPVYIWDMGSNGNFYGFPKQPGAPGGVKVAMHFVDASANTACTPESIDRTVHSHEIEAMQRVLQTRMPQLPGKVVAAATCMYTNTPDDHFLIDWHPQAAGKVLLVSPCSGHGFKFCSVIGEIVAELSLDEKTRHDVSLFRFGALERRPIQLHQSRL